jgi:glycosyltransferase involved in cell wall biosynthesis
MKKKITLIIPALNEENGLYGNIKKIIGYLEITKYDFSIIIIDDGSKDNTWEVIGKLRKEYNIIQGIRFTRNFGKEAAMFAGLKNADSDACIIIDSDLQHPPEFIPKFIEVWEKEGYEIVEGRKRKRGKESIFYRMASKLFNTVMHNLTGFNFSGAADFKLLDRKVVDYLNSLNERNTFLRGLSTWSGFRSKDLLFIVKDRKTGTRKWSFFKLGKFAINALTSFSSAPMQFVTMLGILIFILSIGLGIQTVYKKIAGISEEGFTTIILLILFIGSVLMISLGIIGSYISKIYDEVKHRPRYIVSEHMEGKDE